MLHRGWNGTSLRLLLFATAPPLVLLTGGAAPAHAGSVTVTGANGANEKPYYLSAGAGGSATATTTTPSDPSNTATATGGNGGSACVGSPVSGCYPGRPGAPGGAANATATTSISSGAASAEAASFGGNGGHGGNGEGGTFPGTGGNGGAAGSDAAASSATGSASATASSTGGHGGYGRSLGTGGPFDAGGAATAAASATVSNATGSASATATATGGGAAAGVSPSGAAAASANAQNIAGAALTSASAPAGSSASALTNATVTNAALNSGSAPLPAIEPGRAVSDAILSPKNQTVGAAAMSAAYGGSGQALTYEATAVFDFTTTTGEALDLKPVSYNFADTSAGVAFDNLELEVIVDGGTPHTYKFSSLTGSGGAEAFFAPGHSIPLGTIGAAKQSIEIEYFLGYNSGTSAAVGDGFGFTYDLVDPRSPLAAVPEPSTWVMILVGFAGLAFAGYRARVTELRRY